MVLSILVAIVSAPALLGTQEAIRQSQSKEKREEHRARRCNLIATCVKSSARSHELNGRPVVLRNGKLYIDTGTSDGDEPLGHPYAGYYLPYPDAKHEGLVTTITDVAPIMNWVYIDKDTHEARYGVRLDAQPNLTGPFDCTRQDRRLTFDGWEGWCAVEEAPSLWALYFDKDDDGLRSKVAAGTRVLEIELSRKEKRWRKDGEERQKDQTTKRAVETGGEAPVDEMVNAEPELRPSGVVGVPPGEEKVAGGLRPFKLPRSIFGDPPRPLFFGEEMAVPKSPPPAYYEESMLPVQEVVLPSEPAPEPAPERPRSTTPQKSPKQAPRTPPQNPQNISSGRAYRGSAFETPRQAPLPPSQTPPLPPAPSEPKETPPLVAASSSVTPPTDKRPPPKLNRSSGTRTMSQAQLFEAWATKSTPTKDPTATKNPPSESKRPLSDATSTSNYSDPERAAEDEDEILQLYGGERSTPRTSAQPTSGPSDPAVFARLSAGSSTSSDPAVAKDGSVMRASLLRLESANGQTAVPKTRGATTTTSLPTGVFKGAVQRAPPSQRIDTGPNSPSRTSTRKGDAKLADRERTSSSSASGLREYQRSTRLPASKTESAATQRYRTPSVSSRSRSREVSGVESRATPKPPPPLRQGLPLKRGERPSPRPRAATDAASEGREEGRIDSSRLYREIGDMVGGSLRGRSGSVGGARMDEGRRGDGETLGRRTVRRADERGNSRGGNVR